MSGGRARYGRGIGPYATRVAAVAMLLLAAAAVLVVISGSRDSYEVRAVFDDVRGLIPGGDVTAGAIVVGTVTDVQLNEDDDPEVTMRIDGDFELHEGAIADIRLASNIGAVNRVVDLTEGDPAAPGLGEGAVLSGAQTDNPVDFDLAVSTLTPKVRAQFKDVLIGLDEALLERGPDFDRTLRNSSAALNQTANLLAQVNEDGEALRTLVSQGQTVVSALAENPGDLGEAAERTGALLQTTANRQTELAESTQLLGPALAGGRQLLERTDAAVPRLRELVAGSGPLLDELDPFAELVPPASRAAAPFLRETRALVEDAPDQLRAQRGFLRDAPPVIKRLVPLLDQLNPIADQLRVFTPETVGFFQNVADSASNYDINGHMIRTASTLANFLPPSTQAGGEIGPSDCTPGLLVAPYLRTPGVNECQPWDEWRDSTAAAGEAP